MEVKVNRKYSKDLYSRSPINTARRCGSCKHVSRIMQITMDFAYMWWELLGSDLLWLVSMYTLYVLHNKTDNLNTM